MPALRQLARAVVGFTLLSIGATSCQRRAPGPEECSRFAEAVVGPGRYLTPVLAAQIETQTRECLTRPYDRELLSCVLLTRQARVCLASFHARNVSANANDNGYGNGKELPE